MEVQSAAGGQLQVCVLHFLPDDFCSDDPLSDELKPTTIPTQRLPIVESDPFTKSLEVALEDTVGGSRPYGILHPDHRQPIYQEVLRDNKESSNAKACQANFEDGMLTSSLLITLFFF